MPDDFDPTEISGCTLWLRGNTWSGSIWADQSGNGHDFITPTEVFWSGNASGGDCWDIYDSEFYIAPNVGEVVNGHPSVHFEAESFYQNDNSLLEAQRGTVFVREDPASIWPNADEMIFYAVLKFNGFVSGVQSGTVVGYAGFVGIGAPPVQGELTPLNFDGGVVINPTNPYSPICHLRANMATDGDDADELELSPFPINDWMVVRIRQRAVGRKDLSVRCGDLVSAASGNRILDSAACDTIRYVSIGSPGALTGCYTPDFAADPPPFHGDIAEIIAYNRGLTASEAARVERYLGAKYAIQCVQAASVTDEQGVTSLCYFPDDEIVDPRTGDPQELRPGIISRSWADSLLEVAAYGKLLVRCNIVERGSMLWGNDVRGEITTQDLSCYKDAFRIYKDAGVPRIFAVLPPQFCGTSHGNPHDSVDNPGFSNDYVEEFSNRAASVARDLKDYTADFIIWNEPNNQFNDQTKFTDDPENFASLLYWCWAKMYDELGYGNFNIYWGGLQIDVAPAADVVVPLVDFIDQVYGALTEHSVVSEDQPIWPWRGVNVHIHRGLASSNARDAGSIGTVFNAVRARLHGHANDDAEIIVGEWGDTVEEECSDPGNFLALFHAIRTQSPSIMFQFNHSGDWDDGHWWLVERDYVSANTPGQSARPPVTQLYTPGAASNLQRPFADAMTSVGIGPTRLPEPVAPGTGCGGGQTGAGVYAPLPKAARGPLGQAFYQPSIDPAYIADTSFADVDATNVFVTFTPKASSVAIVASFVCTLTGDGDEASNELHVNLRTVDGGDVLASERLANRLVANHTGPTNRMTCSWNLNNLTPDQVYTYRLGFRASDAHLTGTIHAGDDAAGGWGPISMVAYAT
jgi:hypothetical protein